jgi:phenylpropionate dioxygenase-like ring-hydroxylating dioxygenase large terminal subunit
MRAEDNERLVRVGPGTPAGELFRRYWQPALLASEVPEPDGAPVRLRLLGENLIAFRDTNGRVGLVDAFCPHRRAPLFFGRNEQCGIRCVYHGWKFDVDGNCVDMPSEPLGTQLKDEAKLLSYPTIEVGGIIWAYMGPKDQMPEPPNYEWLRAPATHRFVSKTFEACNYLQALEGGLDTAHSSFLHNNNLKNKDMLRTRDTAPKLDVSLTEFGYSYVSTRRISDGQNYVRVYHYVMPFQQMRGNVTAREDKKEVKVKKLDGHIWVPIDDETTYVYNWALGYDQQHPLEQDFMEAFESAYGRGREDYIPGTFILNRNGANDYLIDRRIQKEETFSGIKGVNTQDFALQEGMGPICDRSKEFLGSSDKAIVTMRRLLLEATRVVESGKTPRGVAPKTHSSMRAHDKIIPSNQRWQDAFGAELEAKW